MKIPDHIIEEIRARADIVSIIGSVVELRRRGKNFVGRCPFHEEKTPSFNVNPERGIFKCFGCGVGGDVFSFVMRAEKLSYPEAIHALAERTGVVIEETAGGDQAVESLYNAMRFAGDFYHRTLGHPEGKECLEYFRKREFSDDTIRKFLLGASANAWDTLTKAATQSNIPAEVLERAGLARKKEGGKHYYDQFRGRAMFPIFSPTGRLIAFGARKIRDDDQIAGKYVNSPETPIYHKSSVLFGLFHAKESLRRQQEAILVEGYADAITLVQHSIENVVASSGTALTTEQIKLLKRYTPSVVLLFDGDIAGASATLRGLDVALEGGLDVKVVALADGKDPDSYVREEGGAALMEKISEAQSFIEFKAETLRARGSFETVEGKTAAVRSIVQSIAKIPDGIKRSMYVKEIAKKFDLYESTLHEELEKMIGQAKKYYAPVGAQQIAPRQSGENTTSGAQSAAPLQRARKIDILDKSLLEALLFASQEDKRALAKSVDVTELDHPAVQLLFAEIVARIAGGNPVSPHALLASAPNDDVRALLATLSVQEEKNSFDHESIQSLVTKLALRHVERAKREAQEELKVASPAKAEQILARVADLERERAALLAKIYL